MAFFPVKRTTPYAHCMMGKAQGSNGSGAVSMTVTFPSAPPEGSFVFILFHASNQDVTLNQPGFDGGLFDYDGFSPTVDLTYAEQLSVVTETTGVYAFWKIAGPNEPATYSFTHQAMYGQIVAGVFEIPAGCLGARLRDSAKHERANGNTYNPFLSPEELVGSHGGDLLISMVGKDNRTVGVIYDTFTNESGGNVAHGDGWTLGFDDAYGASADQSTAVAWRFDASGAPLRNFETEAAINDACYGRTFAFQFEYPQTYIPLDSGFPVVANYTPQSYPAAAGSYNVDITGYTPGRLGIIAIVTDDAGTPDFVTPTGWTRADSGGDSGSSRGTRGLYYKKLEVGETNPVTLALTSGSEPAQASFIEVDNWSGNIADVAFATSDFTTSLLTQTPTQVPLTAPWGVDNTLWLVGLLGMDDPANVTTWPVGYETNQRFDHNGNPTDSRCWIAFTHKQEAVGSITPGAWALDQSESCQTFTMAIRAPQAPAAYFPVRRVRTSQPPAGTRINRAHPIGSRVRALFVYDPDSKRFYDYVSGAYSSALPSDITPFYEPRLNGWMATKNGALTAHAQISNTVLDTRPWLNGTVSVAGFIIDEGDYGGRSMLNCSGGGDDFMLEFLIAANENFGGRIGSGATNQSIPGVTMPDNELFFGSIWKKTGVGARVETNTQQAALSAIDTGVPNPIAHPFTFFPTATSEPQTMGPVVIIEGEIVGQQECVELLQDFWQLFEPEVVWYKYEPATGVVQIVSVDGDDSWADGASGLIILGSGFTS